MTYHIKLNSRKIKKYESLGKLSRETVHSIVDIDEALLVEKDSWYFIDSTAHFFKERSDARLAGECLSQAYAEALNENSAKYSVAVLNGCTGLISPNFQDRDKYQYYDLCELYKLLPSFPKTYNSYTLKKIFETFAYHYDPAICYILIRKIIRRYVFDWYTHQMDGNPRNNNFCLDKETNQLDLGPLFDREQAFGINRSGIFDDEVLKQWIPAIPYEDLSFKDNPYLIEGLDANIMSLLIDYPELTQEALDWVCSLDADKVLDDFVTRDEGIILPDETLSYLKGIAEQKNEEKEKLLQLV